MNLEINHEPDKKVSSNSFSKELNNYINRTITFSIDRFEGNFAVCENTQTNKIINIEKSLLPDDCKEGDIIKFENGKYTLDVSQSKKEKEDIKNLVNSLFKKKK